MCKHPAPISITEIARLVTERKVSPLDEQFQVRNAIGTSLADNLTSPIVEPLQLPETAVLMLAPVMCPRHMVGFAFLELDENVKEEEKWKKKVWHVRLEEQDIVSGGSIQKAKQALLEMIETMNPKPKAIVLCVTCIDVMMGSDFKGVAAEVEEETGVRIGLTSMCVLLNDSTNSPDFARTWTGVMGVLRTPADAPKQKAVNLIGRRPPLDINSDFSVILEKAGYNQVNHFSQFQTLEEFDCMGQAELNIAIGKRCQMVCKSMKKRYQIPHVFVETTVDIDELHKNYQIISQALGVELDDTHYYEYAKRRIKEVVEKCKDMSVVVGENFDENPFKAAVDLCKMGFQVQTIFTRFVKPQYTEAIQWLNENRPNIRVYYSAHPGMLFYTDHPVHYDLAFGMNPRNVDKDTILVVREHRQPDYATLLSVLDEIEAKLNARNVAPDEATTQQTEPMMPKKEILGQSMKNRKQWGVRKRRCQDETII